MGKLYVHTKFTLLGGDGVPQDYPVGFHDFEGDLADHWYVKLHAKEPSDDVGAGGIDPGDTQALDELAAELQSEAERLMKLKADLGGRAAQLDVRETALATREGEFSAKVEAFDAAAKASGNSPKQAPQKK